MDIFVANPKWTSAFPDHDIRKLDFYRSDHSLIFHTVHDHTTMPKETRPYRFSFENKWLMEEDYLEVMSAA